jgi:hypothetical protein
MLRSTILAFVFALSLTGGALQVDSKDDCAKCDCMHAPVSQRCEHCCGVIKGRITSFDNDSVTVRSNGGQATLRLTNRTAIEGNLKEGAQATLRYNKGTKEVSHIKIEGSRFEKGRDDRSKDDKK